MRLCNKCKINLAANPWARQCVGCREKTNREAGYKQREALKLQRLQLKQMTGLVYGKSTH